jgi:asparagine synthase (glutamine-hydrolysing)
MCGITGFVDTKKITDTAQLVKTAEHMADAIRHRGPDDQGVWADADSGVALGFQRLAIIDISPTGHQPMVSADGRYVIVFNGEIYNYRLLRDELIARGHMFKGTSDTEVMLEAICLWGVREAVERLNGMFAFALWDRRERVLFLVRDRLGIKPLYYGWCGSSFLFASELKAILAHPDFQPEINRDALALFLRYNYIPAPYSIYPNIFKLLPGSILMIDPQQPGDSANKVIYWSAREAVERGTANVFTGSDEEAIDALETHLKQSVRERMVADVPLGAFLSGGIDSSLITALMQTQSSRPVKTFSIGFWEAEFDEARFAREVACRLGTEHTELYVTPQEALAVIPRLPELYDEPFSDSSQVPTFLVSQMARQHVTVSLSGDGGDELFGGYNRYLWTRQLWLTFGWAPFKFRSAARRGIEQFSPAIVGLAKGRVGVPLFADKLDKIAEVLDVHNQAEIYYRLVSHWKNPSAVVQKACEPVTILTDSSKWANLPDFTQQMMYLDLMTYLPGDILAKVDRASMGISLENRSPYLDDHRTIEFAWQLPMRMKIRDGKGKWILRKLLGRYLPPEMIDRPKMGFTMPFGEWLRGPLRPWAEELLGETRLKCEGYFDPVSIRKMWQEHLEMRRSWPYHLWDVLMFQAWLENV